MASNSLKQAAAGLLIVFSAAVSAESNDVAMAEPPPANDNVTLQDWAGMEHAEKIDFLANATFSYADELRPQDENLEKAMCIIGGTKEKLSENFNIVGSTLNSYAPEAPQYSANKLVRQVYDKMCGPTVVASIR